MSSPRYDMAVAAVFDPVAPNRNATRNVLFALGFREIETLATLDDLKRTSREKSLDLIIAEAMRPDDPVYDFIRGLRRGEQARNPFVVSIVTTWIPQTNLVRHALDCGVDDIVSRPFSTTVMGERVRTHTLARKNFVVTADYIGPDRRAGGSREHSAKLIPVANSLHMKAVEAKTGAEGQVALVEALVESRRTVNLERMRRAAFHIGVIAAFVRGQAMGETEGQVRKADLERIAGSTREIAALAGIERFDAAVDTCRTVIEVAEAAMNGVDLAKNAQILLRLSVALQVTLTPGRGAEECQAELAETLERIRARGRAS